VNERKKSQKGFVAVTLITVLAIALVLVVYATLLATFQGGEVVVGTVAGNVYYSTTNSTTASDWTPTLNVSGTNDPWYAKVNFTSAYTGNVQITWQLEKKNGNWANATQGTDANVTTVITTSFTLNGTSGQTAYASTSGLIGTNQNWGAGMLKQGSYRIAVYIDSKA